MPDLSALISRMADELDHYRQLLRDDRREVHPLAVEARAALAQPEPEAVGPTMLRTERRTGPFGEWTALIPCNSPAPAPAGEVGELVAWLRDRAESTSLAHNALRITRAADLLEQRHPAPVPVSERLPGPEDCDAEGRCWWWRTDDADEWWELLCISDAREYNAGCGNARYTHWLPFNALPLPQGGGCSHALLTTEADRAERGGNG